MEGNIIPMVLNLGVTYDKLLHFAAYATFFITKVKMLNKVLKALACTTWGIDKETIITTYE